MLVSIKPTNNSEKPDQAGFARLIIVTGILMIMILIGTDIYRLESGRMNLSMPEIRSAISGYCLDDHHDGKGPNAVVDSWKCNGTVAQHWSVVGNAIKHNDAQCLDVQDNSKNQGSLIVLNPCNGSSGEDWSIDQGGFQNPNSGLCLTIPGSKTGKQLIIYSCDGLDQINEAWAADTWISSDGSSGPCVVGSKGAQIACYAERQWAAWESGSPSHKILLNDYTDGNSYEEWCADFVSYVYREAGYPFANGERDGWDEYDANDVQNMGFTLHPATGYTPSPGDVAFFDYPGGHVEIVVSGGSDPTFIYGDSGTTDPATGNGEMNEDMLTSDGTAGQLVYYLSPN